MGKGDSRLGVCVLGATGSVGRQALDVCRRHGDRLRVVSLAAQRDVKGLCDAAAEFGVRSIAIADPEAAGRNALRGLPGGVDGGFGMGAVCDLAILPEVDVVVMAIVGAAAIRPTLRALEAGKRVALANKECLVAAGSLVMGAAKPGQIVPVDSEHSAIFQCLEGERPEDLHAIWLTCSGGPFRGFDRERLSRVTAEEALAHPTWTMGPKITVDCADLMNKGLEVIEASWLFGVDPSRVHVLIHPESKVHSMVEYVDGSTKAQLGPPDMRLPIQYALSYPERWETPAPRVDWREAGTLTFDAPDLETFRCLGLAIEAARVGGTMPCAMNAANEVANEAFRQGRIRLTDVDVVVEVVMEDTAPEPVSSLEQVLAVDSRARESARLCLKELSR